MSFRSNRDRALLINTESTYGTAATMAAANAIVVMNSQVRTIADTLERTIDRPTFGGNPMVLVGKRVELDFEVDLIGAATPGITAPLSAVYRACGHSETLTASTSALYAPVSQNQASATIDFYWSGIRFRLLGARGSMDLSFSVKDYAKASVKMIGLLTLPTDAEVPSGTSYTAFQTPAAIETATWLVQVGAYNAHAVSLTLNANATLPLIETSESRQVIWTDRKPAGEMIVVRDAALTTWNPWALADAHSIVNIVNTVTGGAGRNVSVPIRAQLAYPEPTEVDGVAAFRIPFTAIPNAGDDEYSILLT